MNTEAKAAAYVARAEAIANAVRATHQVITTMLFVQGAAILGSAFGLLIGTFLFIAAMS